MNLRLRVVRQILFLVLSSCFLTISFAQSAPGSSSQTQTPSTSSDTLSVNPTSPKRVIGDFADLVEKASPAVVNIRTTEKVTVYQVPSNISPQDQAEFFRRFFGIPLPGIPQQQAPQQPKNQAQQAPKSQEQDRGTGSGFVIDTAGYILTNAHVVEGATNIYVTLTDKREFKAKLIGSDPKTDVALVKIDAPNLTKLPIGESSRVRVGEWVLAIGSPFGFDNTVSAGIISAKGREVNDSITPFIQTDVAINPGNSGGPLLNTRGEVIGINSQIFSKSGGFMGISFAIPIDDAIRIADILRTSGKVVRGRIGITITELNKELADSIGFTGKPAGVVVRALDPNAPAAQSGIEVGDVILKINDHDIVKGVDLTRVVSETKPGSKVKLQVWRKGNTRELNVPVIEIEQPRKS
jgi:serine protease Do